MDKNVNIELLLMYAIGGKPCEELERCLALTPKHMLALMAEIYGIPKHKKDKKAELAKKLCKLVVSDFREEAELLPDDNYRTLVKLADAPEISIQGMSFTDANMLLRLGICYIFRNGSDVRLVLPRELRNVTFMDQPDFQKKRERNQEFCTYAKALVNLYGILEIEQFVYVFNLYHQDRTNRREAEEYLRKMSAWQWYFKYADGLLFVDDLDVFEEWRNVAEDIRNLNYFTPSREQIAVLADDRINDTIQSEALQNFILRKFPDDQQTAEDIFEMQMYDIEKDKPLPELLDDAQDDIPFDTETEFDSFTELVAHADKHTRKWLYRGFTGQEIMEQSETDLNNEGRPERTLTVREREKILRKIK